MSTEIRRAKCSKCALIDDDFMDISEFLNRASETDKKLYKNLLGNIGWMCINCKRELCYSCAHQTTNKSHLQLLYF